ncbi:uncharacterized protein LOC127254720 [Andrographis paniculata]|uniref:uncharacterized protein LOC127254720 n=1 Tax=Andrographis paniculata TaxID=175694 RepID=UPI0021E915B5|nr:uncharacterized protein LOC127254720 [Andrographis paniculata]
MAAAFSAFPTPIVPAAASRSRKSPPAAQRSSWWAPVFGWSSEPDYVNGNARIEPDLDYQEESGRVVGGKKQYRGCLTEEKAKELRRKTIQTYNFHDVMYHSAIASRLASDLSGR